MPTAISRAPTSGWSGPFLTPTAVELASAVERLLKVGPRVAGARRRARLRQLRRRGACGGTGERGLWRRHGRLPLRAHGLPIPASPGRAARLVARAFDRRLLRRTWAAGNMECRVAAPTGGVGAAPSGPAQDAQTRASVAQRRRRSGRQGRVAAARADASLTVVRWSADPGLGWRRT